MNMSIAGLLLLSLQLTAAFEEKELRSTLNLELIASVDMKPLYFVR